MKRAIVVVEDPAAAAAERLATAVARGGDIVLAGGSTPRHAYEILAARDDLDWGAAAIWLGDDRCVPPDHEHSNSRMVRETLLDRLHEDRAPAAWHPIHGELGPEGAAEALESDLESAFASRAPVPVFDLVLLGLGPDAHTASLFPGDAALAEREHWAVGVETPGMAPFVSRATLTLPVLNAAREVVFLISGEDKADAVARAFAGPPDPEAPASLVRPEAGTMTLLLDGPAAMGLGSAR